MKSQAPSDVYIVLVSPGQADPRRLTESVRDLIRAAERHAQMSGSTTNEAVDVLLRQRLEQSGANVTALQIHQAVRRLDEMRRTTNYETLEINVSSPKPTGSSPTRNGAVRGAHDESPPDAVFEPEKHFPEAEALALYDRLAGIDEQKAVLINELTLATNPARVEAWSRKHHAIVKSTLLTAYRQRVPLIVLQGDVGTGKTALAESVGAALVRDGIYADVRLLKITGQVRGQGLVGQMSDEIVKAFAYAESRAAFLGANVPLLLLVDEADAIATSRSGEQMHHEDKAGVNTLLQRLDRLKTLPVRPIVIFITNRPGAVDPALARRAGTVLRFERPSLDAREAIFRSMLREYEISAPNITRLARETERKEVRFTASDLTDKILVRALQDAVRLGKPLTVDVVSAAISKVEPSPVFGE